MNKSLKKNIGFISLLIGSWVVMFFITTNWWILEIKLEIIKPPSEGYYLSLVYFLPIFYCIIFGYVFALLLTYRKAVPARGLYKSISVWRTAIWCIPSLAFALWSIMALCFVFIPSDPPWFDGTYYFNFELNCGVIVGIVLGLLRNTLIAETGNKFISALAVLKILIPTAIYFLLFYLVSIHIRTNIHRLYGSANYGFGAYWMTVGNVIFFGILFGVLFRIPQFSLRGKWVYRSNGTSAWVIILAILIVGVGFVWAFSSLKTYLPTFPDGRVPDIAVVWMFALGYLLGRNVEQTEAKREPKGDGSCGSQMA